MGEVVYWTDQQIARLQRDVDELRAEIANLAHRLNEAIANLQMQLDDKVNADYSGIDVGGQNVYPERP